MEHLDRLQDAMHRAGFDALLLGGEAAGQFAAGHTRIGVHMPGWPVPAAVVPASGLPHIVTADPDGATALPADHVHGMMWNPQTLVSSLKEWLGGGRGLRLGADSLSPGGRALIEAALPGSTIADATRLLADVLLCKSPEEVDALGTLCGFVNAAAEKALQGGRVALLDALDGAFPITYPIVSDRRVSVAVRRGGIIGEARIGPGDPTRGERAMDMLQPGAVAADVAAALPPGVEVVGIGGSYQAPLIRNGWAWPEDLVLRPGAVLGVHWDACGVTVAVERAGLRVLSPAPKEVAR